MEQQANNSPVSRPVFLTILCILSWLWQLIAAIFLVFIIAGAGEGGADMVYIGISSLTLIITIVGVVMMWKLKRIGFFLYVAGTLGSIMNEYYFESGWGKAVMIFGVSMIALYAVNFKKLQA